MLIGGFPSRGFPDRSFPDRAFPGYEAVTGGGAGKNGSLQRYPTIVPKKKRTDEELILMFYAMIDEEY